jgi:hypothetical protein
MLDELAILPAWYAEKGDYVYTETDVPPGFLSLLPEAIRPEVTIVSREAFQASPFPEMLAAPWGLSPQSAGFYQELMSRYGLAIELPVWKEAYAALMGRQTGAACFKRIAGLLPSHAFPSVPLFFSGWPAIEAWLCQHPGASVIKTPYSSSGRGLLWLREGALKEKDRNWIRGALNKQGCVSVEPALEAIRDFALEFFINEQGEVSYEGISVFDTSPQGAYRGNRLMRQEALEHLITLAAGKALFRQVKEATAVAIGEVYAGYAGYIGVDMLVYRAADGTSALHPCIEVNMRYTMGMAAIRLFDTYIHPDAEGVFNLTYGADPETVVSAHRKQEEAYPLTFKEGKLRSGYLSLCPVTPQTHYIAYILIQ